MLLLTVLFHLRSFFLRNPGCMPNHWLSYSMHPSYSYRFAPEHAFPAGVEDARESLQWASSHASQLDASSARGFLVGGVSDDANFAAAPARQALETQL
ncbi:hypothetical protein F5Y09DRAFT_314694 [Xylaria sp. FL1042]|nr:hypothetical protein F5Y09DRAFT_314694 [Xylaria sp. FL1042]